MPGLRVGQPDRSRSPVGQPEASQSQPRARHTRMASLVENKRRTQERVARAGTLVDPHAASCLGIGAPQRVTFIRHGQSEGNAARSRGIKRTDPRLLDCGLTRKGVGEATAAGADRRVEPDLVVVSPLTRALATCLHLRFAAAPIVCYPGIKEIGSKLLEDRALENLARIKRRSTSSPSPPRTTPNRHAHGSSRRWRIRYRYFWNVTQTYFIH